MKDLLIARLSYFSNDASLTSKVNAALQLQLDLIA